MPSLWKAIGKGEKRSVSTQEECGFCRQAMKKDDKHSGMFYTVKELEEQGGKIHEECWLAYQETTAPRCLHCEAPVAHLPGRFGGKFVKVDEPPGRVHSECWDAFRGSRPADPEPATPAAETCGHCKERIAVVRDKFSGRFFELEGGIKIHAECRTAYHEANTPKCQQCSAPIAPEGGRFSGGFYELMGEHEGARVHTECYGSWLEAVAPRCLSCGEAVRRKEGKFSGDFCIFDAGKTHKECAQAYLEETADKCSHCGKAVLKTGALSGSYYPVGGGDDKVHVECWEDWGKVNPVG